MNSSSFFYWPLIDSRVAGKTAKTVSRPQDLASIVGGGREDLRPAGLFPKKLDQTCLVARLTVCFFFCFFLQKYFQIKKMKSEMNFIKKFGCFLFLFRLYEPISFPYCFLFFYAPSWFSPQFLAIISISFVTGMEPNGLTVVMGIWGRFRRLQIFGTVSVPSHTKY